MQAIKFDIEAHRDRVSGTFVIAGAAAEPSSKLRPEPEFRDVSTQFSSAGSTHLAAFAIEASFTAPVSFTDDEPVFAAVATQLGLNTEELVAACRVAAAQTSSTDPSF